MTTLIIPDDHPNHRVLLRRARRQSARSPSTSLPRRRSHSHSRRRPPRRPASHRSSPSTSLSRSRSSVRTANSSSRRACWSLPRRRRWRPLIAPLIARLIARLIAPLMLPPPCTRRRRTLCSATCPRSRYHPSSAASPHQSNSSSRSPTHNSPSSPPMIMTHLIGGMRCSASTRKHSSSRCADGL